MVSIMIADSSMGASNV